MLLVYQQIWYTITIYYIIYILDTLIMILCLYKTIIHIYVWFLTTAHQLHLAFVFAQPSYCHPNSSAKEEQIPGPVLRELCTPPWWLQWNLRKKFFVTFWFLVLNFKEAKKSQSLTFSRCKKQMFHRRVEISIVLIPGTFQLGWKAAIWRTSSQILCSGQDVRGGGGADLCASTPVVIWRWTLDCIKLQKFYES